MTMKKLALAVFVSALALTGPAYAQFSPFVTENVASLKRQPPHANPFNAALQREYLAVGEEALAESDHQHADRYVRKGFTAGLGAEVLPENPARWWIAYGRRATLVEWHGKLMQVLPAGRTSRPAAAARAQVMYDCWLEEEHEDIWMRDLTAGARRAPNLYQPNDIAKCRRAFFCAMAEMGVAVPEPCVQTADINFRFDQPKSDRTASRADLWPGGPERAGGPNVAPGAAGLDNLIGVMRGSPTATALLKGHTDTVGSPAYNLGLSERRARFIAAELGRAGVAANRVQFRGVGKAELAVPTPDQTREVRNRRVSYTIQYR
jgi:hypothetical protein